LTINFLKKKNPDKSLLDFGMRISEFKIKEFRSFYKFFHPQSAICNSQSFRSFSLPQQRLLLILALFILALLYFRFDTPFSLPSAHERVQEVVVEITGEVRYPGIHLCKIAPTLEEVIEKAGGPKEIASFNESLSTRPLETGTLVTVVKESQGEIRVRLGKMEPKKLLVFSLPLDLNQVTGEDLCWIPGIGESLAQEMIAYRQRRGSFRSLDELKQVKGMGEKKYKSLRPFLTVRYLIEE
jgi:competence protein ComEA